ncbi:MAG: hypothetical protein M1817_003676 [Caeruleum heppii]|nr:MAG: hypothetical protein M1817_003676 [Caeruleum heppii]
MLPKPLGLSTILIVWWSLCFVTLAVPRLGIQKDWLSNDWRNLNHRVQSYSGRISFPDADKDHMFPPETMKPEQLLNLARIAWDEMAEIHKGAQLSGQLLPRAMIVMAFEREIAFASSMKQDFQGYYKNNANGDLVDALEACQTNGLACGEPNVLDLWMSAHEGKKPNHEGYGDLPRIAAWWVQESSGRGFNIKPCSKHAGIGYGCEDIVREFKLEPISGVIPTEEGQDDWRFSWKENPRGRCFS